MDIRENKNCPFYRKIKCSHYIDGKCDANDHDENIDLIPSMGCCVEIKKSGFKNKKVKLKKISQLHDNSASIQQPSTRNLNEKSKELLTYLFFKHSHK